MANSKVYLPDLKSGPCFSTVECRLLRVWEVKKMKQGGELRRLNMLIVDMNGTIMVASISAKRLILFRSRLIAGAVYSVSGFFVSDCALTLRLTDSSLMIMFNDSTSLDVLSDTDSELPVEEFRFRNEAELLELASASTLCSLQNAPSHRPPR
ncbi:hypothetical protein YC2023_081074 [Brassica napus]|uniref:(rape) hypothetical protein n=1 Tax=Brassica napus TaxID=3708 RepID=A0A816LLD5_BRANA|nr:unnamed protein product [Brassica napus]